MEDQAQGCCSKTNSINFRLLPIKLHYFILFGGLGGVMPYVPVLAKELGISATAVGIVFTILPFTVMVAKPTFGAITDHFRNIKVVIAALVIVSSVSYFVILFIPRLSSHPPGDKHVRLECTEHVSQLTFPKTFNSSCLSEKLFNDTECNIQIDECPLLGNETGSDVTTCSPFCNQTSGNLTLKFEPNPTFFNKSTDKQKFVISNMYLNGQNLEKICSCPLSFLAVVTCVPSIQNCSSPHLQEDSVHDVYSTYQFWTFAILSIMAGVGAAVMFCLSDAACYDLLGDRPDQYGRQRLWATVSWGMVALLTGFLNDLASEGSTHTDYSPGFYLMLGLSFLDLILLFRIKLTKTTFSSNICQDVSSVFVSCEVVAFAMGVFIIGGLTGMLWNYQFWFLQTLGASQLLLGLTIVVQCLLAEVPFFFFSGYIIDKLGHMNCLILTFVAFSLRFILYYALQDPWYVLPIEILHGQTFGTFYATMTSYARVAAPPGSEATMQGVLGGLYEGLGVAVGSLLGGIGFDQLGGHHTFLTAALVSALCTISFCVIGQILKQKKKGRMEVKATFRETESIDEEK